MKRLIVIYHAYLIQELYERMVEEQIRKLDTSLLYYFCDRLHIGVVGAETSQSIDWPLKATVECYSENKEETPTLKWIRDYAKDHPDEYVLYFHTKGISRFSLATESWRKYMEYFVIENWTDCVQKLDEGYDCCGVEWMTDTFMGYFPHFSGNFWWATTDYINTLDHSYLDHPNRLYREFWIGTNPNVKKYEFHHRGGNPYEIIYDRINYAKQ